MLDELEKFLKACDLSPTSDPMEQYDENDKIVGYAFLILGSPLAIQVEKLAKHPDLAGVHAADNGLLEIHFIKKN